MRKAVWDEMVTAQRSGLVQALGVANFDNEALLGSLIPPPKFLQVEYHPFHHNESLLHYCREHGIQLIAYGSNSWARGRPARSLLSNGVLQSIAKRHASSPQSVSLAWSLAKGVAVIPRSTSEKHLASNLRIESSLVLSSDEIVDLDAMQLKQARFAYEFLSSTSQHWASAVDTTIPAAAHEVITGKHVQGLSEGSAKAPQQLHATARQQLHGSAMARDSSATAPQRKA